MVCRQLSYCEVFPALTKFLLSVSFTEDSSLVDAFCAESVTQINKEKRNHSIPKSKGERMKQDKHELREFAIHNLSVTADRIEVG
jgi:hypothetical protein